MATLNQELGTHEVTVKTVKVIEEEGGTVKVAVTVQFKDGEKWTKYLGNKTPKQLEILRKSLKAIGFDIDKYPLSQLVNHPDSLDGEMCEVVVEENQYNGNTTNQIAWINKLRKAPPASTLDELTAKLRAVKKGEEEQAEGGGL